MKNNVGMWVVGVVVVTALGATTGLVVHHNDKTSNDNAMKQADAMHMQEQTKAVNAAVMKQKQTDAMVSNDTMTKTSSDTMSH